MARARLIFEVGGHPTQYYAAMRAWAPLLGLSIRDGQLNLYDNQGGTRASTASQTFGLPAWRCWSDLYAFLAGGIELASRCEAEETSPYLQSTRARDLFEAHCAAFTYNDIAVPRPVDYQGAAYLEAFGKTLSNLAGWVVQNV